MGVRDGGREGKEGNSRWKGQTLQRHTGIKQHTATWNREELEADESREVVGRVGQIIKGFSC